MSYVNGMCIIKRQSGPFRQSVRKEVILFSCAMPTYTLYENENLLLVLTYFFFSIITGLLWYGSDLIVTIVTFKLLLILLSVCASHLLLNGMLIVQQDVTFSNIQIPYFNYS